MPRYTTRAEIPKRILTYSECEQLLLKQGSTPPWHTEEYGDEIAVRAHGNMFLAADRSTSHFCLRYYSTDRERWWWLATIKRTTGGSTVYELDVVDDLRRPSKRRGKEKAGAKEWRDFAERLTPYVRPEKPGKWELEQPHRYLIQERGPPSGMTTVMRLGTGGYSPNLFFSPKPHSCLQPTRREWVRRFVDGYARCTDYELRDRVEALRPKFLLRYRRFAARLQRELNDLCEGVLLAPGSLGDRPTLSVTPYGREGVKQKILVLQMTQHDLYTRSLFHLDGDYTLKHFCVRGMEQFDHPFRFREPKYFTYIGAPPAAGTFVWPNASEAVAGVREWLMSQLHIPGL